MSDYEKLALSRRGVIASAAALGAAGLLASSHIAPAQAQQGGKTFVLVHGANNGGYVWKYVAAQLRAKGHSVYTPTLSGLADR